LTKQSKSERDAAVSTTTEGEAQDVSTTSDALTPREEKVLRMVHGMSEEDSHLLQFALGADEDTQMKLALIEDQVLRYLKASEATGEVRISPAELLSAWLEDE